MGAETGGRDHDSECSSMVVVVVGGGGVGAGWEGADICPSVGRCGVRSVGRGDASNLL